MTEGPNAPQSGEASWPARGTILPMSSALQLAARLLHSPQFKTHWRVLLVLMIGVTCWFAFTPRPPGFEFKDADKVNHLAAFSAMTVAGFLSRPPGARPWLVVLVGMLLFALLIEAVQSQLPARTAEWGDVLADALGMLLGTVMLRLLHLGLPAEDFS
jgi:VanZ family protein